MRLIDIDDDRNCYIGNDGEYERWNIDPDVLAEAHVGPKKGKWIDMSEDYGDYDYKCSICGSVQWDNTDFCPDCGSDMRLSK